MSFLLQKLEDARRLIHKRVPKVPGLAMVLGSGLGGLLSEMEIEREIPFSEVPNVKPASVEGHEGKYVFGKLNGVDVVCLKGRLHYYEGHSMEDVVFPMRAIAFSGVNTVLLTNAAGSLHKKFKPASLVTIKDHINLMGNNPLIGPNVSELGPRFPDLTFLYDPKLRKLISKAAKTVKVKVDEGIYVACHGPSYETPAEIDMFKKMGGDLVGMSTVPEAIALHHMGRRVVAVSCVTNLAAGSTGEVVEHSEVLENATKAYKNFARLVSEFAKLWAKDETEWKKEK